MSGVHAALQVMVASMLLQSQDGTPVQLTRPGCVGRPTMETLITTGCSARTERLRRCMCGWLQFWGAPLRLCATAQPSQVRARTCHWAQLTLTLGIMLSWAYPCDSCALTSTFHWNACAQQHTVCTVTAAGPIEVMLCLQAVPVPSPLNKAVWP